VSFTSVLPTPQLLLKAAPPPPTDRAKGVDQLVSLAAASAPADLSSGVEALTALAVSLPPPVDSAGAADRPALAGPSAYGYILRMVKRGDIVLPDDQNNVVHAWRAKLEVLDRVRRVLEEGGHEVLSEFVSRYNALKSIVDAMPLVKEGDWVYAEHFNLHLRALQKLIELEELLVKEVCGSPSDMLQLLDAMKLFAAQLEERGTGDVVASADWNAVKQALAVAPKLDELAEERAVTTVYLFREADWSTAKRYADDDSLIFCTHGIDTLPSGEVRELVASKRVVFVIEVDTEPYYPLPAPAWYPVFYTVLKPPFCGVNVATVTDPCFRQFLGYSVPALWDYCVSLRYKVSGAWNWTGDSCGWGYKVYEKGAIVEVPYDGFWESAEWLGRFVDAISNCLLGLRRPLRILYLGRYVSGTPGWHLCHPIDACWRALASARKWRLVDLR